MYWLSTTVWSVISGCIILLLILPCAVYSDPVEVDFNLCQASEYPIQPVANSPNEAVQCCPPKPTQDPIDGLPARTSKHIRVREAYQCTNAAYRRKLARGYALMKALPDEDPRSFTQQWFLHCSYCGGAFYLRNGNMSRGIDIHFSWFFFSWHRFFLYFHERILQSLLKDNSFSLNYWNWDNPYTVGRNTRRACRRIGHNFPSAYADNSSSLYDVNRSQNAKGFGRLNFPDLSFNPQQPAAQQPLFNATEATVIRNNLNSMYQVMVSAAPTAMTFMGVPYRAGDLRGNPSFTGGGGLFELGVHGGPHFWTGQDPPSPVNDMGALAFSARDPVFYAHHSNVDRLFTVWRDIGPILNQTRAYYTDPDFLNASFLFYDEKKVLRRVKVRDGLDTEKLGYIYQTGNDQLWLNFTQTRCSNLSYADTISEAEALPTPVRDSAGKYHLGSGQTFVTIIPTDGPGNGTVMLLIDDIQLDRQTNDGFDVYLDWVEPSDNLAPRACAEYVGRFLNIAQAERSTNGTNQLMWTADVGDKWSILQIPSTADEIVISIVPFLQNGTDTITFGDITVTSS